MSSRTIKTSRVPEEFGDCRTLFHAWDYTTVKREGKFWIQGLQCLRCKTERTQKINARTGERVGNSYVYPEGYVITEGGALTAAERGQLRISTYKRRAEELPNSRTIRESKRAG